MMTAIWTGGLTDAKSCGGDAGLFAREIGEDGIGEKSAFPAQMRELLCR